MKCAVQYKPDDESKFIGRTLWVDWLSECTSSVLMVVRVAPELCLSWRVIFRLAEPPFHDLLLSHPIDGSICVVSERMQILLLRNE